MKQYVQTIALALAFPLLAGAQDVLIHVDTSREPIHAGKYEASTESLSDYQCPEWFRDAKFGIWAHWGVQCAAEDGDWYARGMYQQGNGQYNYQIDALGHPSEKGFKDWIPRWKAERWQPDSLVKFYKDCGARYFFCLANHHDNFDNWNSKYQPWNSVNMGPHKDIVGGWAAAARKQGLPLGVSVHAAHSWVWYETSRGADSRGPLKGVRYDGWLTKADGKGTWWEGYDPQDLYEQRHPLSRDNRHWDWDTSKVTLPDQAFCDRIYNRTVDLINQFSPDIVYFDDTYLPLWPVSDCGLAITAHLYNKSMAEHGGKNQAIVTGKVLNDDMKKTILWDVERGSCDQIQALPWQTCTCIGSWHYDKHVYYNDGYKTPQQVITMLIDIVSKNGNLLLSVPLRSDGTIDPTEHRIVARIGEWMKANGEGIYGTRPWKTFGEGPSADKANPINAQGFNEGRVKQTASDIRYTAKGRHTVYAFVMGQPEADITLRHMGRKTLLGRQVRSVELLGSTEKVAWRQTASGLTITKPSTVPFGEALCYKVTVK